MIYPYSKPITTDGMLSPHKVRVLWHAMVSSYECKKGCLHHESEPNPYKQRVLFPKVIYE